MITSKWIDGNGGNNDSRMIRREVFIREQGTREREEFDDLDKTCTHLVLYDENRPVACGRLYFMGDKVCVLGRIAVLKASRGQHLGDMLVRMLLDRGMKNGAKRFELSAQVQAQGFYERFGFEAYGGEYKEAKLPHTRMKADAANVKLPRECDL
jgi:predicted GNAT family N-acyltransferase